MKYINVKEETGISFYMKNYKELESPIVMLNLLKFRSVADYSSDEKLQITHAGISGEEAYDNYMKAVIPLLKEAGSELIFHGSSSNFLIGPDDESWDKVLLVKHASIKAFMAFASLPEYKAIEGHRTAALADSRLLPIREAK